MYLLAFLFLIASGVSLHLLHLVSHSSENRARRFRFIVVVLYGMSGMLVLLMLKKGV